MKKGKRIGTVVPVSGDHISGDETIQRPNPPQPCGGAERMPDVLAVAHCTFEAGMCYLFFGDDSPEGWASAPLWAIFDRQEEGRILLEVSTSDLLTFRRWTPLAAEYAYARRMTCAEIRDFCFNLGYAAARSEPLSVSCRLN